MLTANTLVLSNNSSAYSEHHPMMIRLTLNSNYELPRCVVCARPHRRKSLFDSLPFVAALRQVSFPTAENLYPSYWWDLQCDKFIIAPKCTSRARSDFIRHLLLVYATISSVLGIVNVIPSLNQSAGIWSAGAVKSRKLLQSLDSRGVLRVNRIQLSSALPMTIMNHREFKNIWVGLRKA